MSGNNLTFLGKGNSRFDRFMSRFKKKKKTAFGYHGGRGGGG